MDQSLRDETAEPTLRLEDVRWTDGQWERFLEILFGTEEDQDDEELPA